MSDIKVSICSKVLALALVATATAASSDASAQTNGSSPPPAAATQVAIPNEKALTVLVDSTLLALNHANLTGDYTVFVKLGAPPMRNQAFVDELAAAFKQFREVNLDMAPLVLYEPVWDFQPAMQGGLLRLVGHVPSRPQELHFDLSYAQEGGRWKVVSINVSLRNPGKARSR